MIINNLADIHKVFQNIEDGITKAYTTFSFDSSEAVKAFGSFTDVTKYLIELDVLNLMFGFLGIGLWGKGRPHDNP